MKNNINRKGSFPPVIDFHYNAYMIQAQDEVQAYLKINSKTEQ